MVAEDDRRRMRRVLWAMPQGLYVLGTAASGRRNLMTVSLATQACVEPPMVAVAVERVAWSHALLAEGGVFALSLLDRQDRALVRRFVKPVAEGPEPGELGGEPVEEAVTGAPVLRRALGFLDCRVTERLELGSHSLFVGEVLAAGERGVPAEPRRAGVDGPAGHDAPSPAADQALGAMVLRMEDTRMHYGG